MDHSPNARLEATELTEADLIHAPLHGPNDEKIGTVSRVHRVGEETKVMVDVGGFLGVAAKSVALPVSRLDFMRGDDGQVHAMTSLTKDEVKALPEHPLSAMPSSSLRSGGTAPGPDGVLPFRPATFARLRTWTITVTYYTAAGALRAELFDIERPTAVEAQEACVRQVLRRPGREIIGVEVGEAEPEN